MARENGKLGFKSGPLQEGIRAKVVQFGYLIVIVLMCFDFWEINAQWFQV